MPQPGIVTNGLLAEYHAARAYLGVSQGHNQGASTQWWDTGGLGNHGTLNTYAFTALSGWSGTGTLGDPFRLTGDGGSDYVALPDLSAAEDHDFTYEVWTVSTRTGAGNSFLASETSAGTAPVVGLYTTTGGLLKGGIWGAGWGGYVEVSTPGNFNTGVLRHGVLTGDGANLRLYVDGSLVDGPRGGLAASAALTTTRFGGDPSAGFCDAGLAVVRFYSRGLTASEVAQNNAAGYLWPLIGNPGSISVPPARYVIKVGGIDIPVVG